MGRVKDYYQTTIPNTLRLADGREFDTAELLNRANQNKINLKRDGTTVKKCAPARAPKYTNIETEWIVGASTKDIAKKFGCTLVRADYIKQIVAAREGIGKK